MIFYARGDEHDVLKNVDLRRAIDEAFEKLGHRKKVLAIPPDFTRFHSHSGILTEILWNYYKNALTDILPALGTHSAMTADELRYNVRFHAAQPFSCSRLAA